MRDHKIRFQHPAEGNTPGGGSDLELDGVDIAPVVTGLRIEHDAGDGLPRLTLVMPIGRLDTETAAALVEVDEATRHVLRTLGWTPPADDDEDVRAAIARRLRSTPLVDAYPESADVDELAADVLTAIRDDAR